MLMIKIFCNSNTGIYFISLKFSAMLTLGFTMVLLILSNLMPEYGIILEYFLFRYWETSSELNI